MLLSHSKEQKLFTCRIPARKDWAGGGGGGYSQVTQWEGGRRIFFGLKISILCIFCGVERSVKYLLGLKNLFVWINQYWGILSCIFFLRRKFWYQVFFGYEISVLCIFWICNMKLHWTTPHHVYCEYPPGRLRVHDLFWDQWETVHCLWFLWSENLTSDWLQHNKHSRHKLF